jgi:hypothetical protein
MPPDGGGWLSIRPASVRLARRHHWWLGQAIVPMLWATPSPSGGVMTIPPDLPSLDLISKQVASERESITGHAESLDTKAGVVLGFAGVLVGLGATAQAFVERTGLFEVGLGFAVGSGVLAVASFFPRRYPVVEVLPLREQLTAQERDTKLLLLDTQIEMVIELGDLVKGKGRSLRGALAALIVAAGLVVAGTVEGGGKSDVRATRNTVTIQRGPCSPRPASVSTSLPPRQEPHRLCGERSKKGLTPAPAPACGVAILAPCP